MTVEQFESQLRGHLDQIRSQVMTETGEWTVKGFIDIYQRIYSISLDTKVLSKVLELLMYPVLREFAQAHQYELVLARAQNQYPDLSFVAHDGSKYAVDIKTTYRTGQSRDGRMRVNGMTLGTFMGYFRDRESASISTFPYSDYEKHYVLGVVYTQADDVDESRAYEISELAKIPSVARDFVIFLQEKYRIASDRPGSGNTRNIGSTVYLDELIDGTGVFEKLGLEVFDDYWMNYRNRGMAREEGFSHSPYRNLREYRAFKARGSDILSIPEDQIETDDE